MNREAWLSDAIDLLRPTYAAAGFALPAALKATCSWPVRGGASNQRRVVGQCFGPEASANGVTELFVSPVQGTGPEAIATLAHELIHAACPKAGHKGQFVSAMHALRFEGKPTHCAPVGAVLAGYLALVASLGMYPHATVTAQGQGHKQSTRLIKVICIDCGYPARVTRQWLRKVGPPHCPEHGAMVIDGPMGV